MFAVREEVDVLRAKIMDLEATVSISNFLLFEKSKQFGANWK